MYSQSDYDSLAEFDAILRRKHRKGRPRYIEQLQNEIDHMLSEKPRIRMVYDVDETAESSEGMRRLNKVLMMIDSIPCAMAELGNRVLPQTQREMARAIISTCLPAIVGEAEWVHHAQEFMDRINVKTYCPRKGVLAARQNGKTWTAAVVAAALMVTIPGFKISNFTSQLNQAKILQTYVRDILTIMGFNPGHNSDASSIWIDHEGGVKSEFQAFSMNAYVYTHMHIINYVSLHAAQKTRKSATP